LEYLNYYGRKTMGDLVRLGYKMKKWISSIISRDFGKDVSYAKGLYNILCLYEKYVPTKAKLPYKKTTKRLRKTNGFK